MEAMGPAIAGGDVDVEEDGGDGEVHTVVSFVLGAFFHNQKYLLTTGTAAPL